MDAKEKKMINVQATRRKQARYEGMIGLPGSETWSAQIPVYCYTTLCPVPGLQSIPEQEKRTESKEHSQGIRPMKAEKLCLCCRKRWPLDCGRERCNCEEQGYLYIVGTYRHPAIGGESIGQRNTRPVLRDERRDKRYQEKNQGT